MIDLKLLKENTDIIKRKILLKDPTFPVDMLVSLSKKVSSITNEIFGLQEKINKLSNPKEQKETLETIKEEVKKIKQILEEKNNEAEELKIKLEELAYSCPNIPMDELPIGNKEANKIIKTVGEKKAFAFEVKNHVSLLTKYNEKEYHFGAKISKSGFFAYKSKLAWLIYKLATICLKHNELNGFSVIHIPQLTNKQTMTNASNLPRFKDELFYISEENLILIPTAEVILASYLEEAIVEKSELPIRLTAWTKCYRREAGGYGGHERGLIRMHEFEKVEIFSFTTPEAAEKEHQYMVNTVETLLQKLNLHYQVVLLATQDCSFPSAKTYDIELWLPGQKEYKEVSSISNCTDFQSRRTKSKYRNDKKNNLLYTLNGSSLALPRLMVALLETWQTESGDIDFDGLFSLLTKIEQN